MTEKQPALQVVRDVLEHPPSGLFTDIDGTISRVAPHPDDALVEDEARTALRALSGQFEVVAAVSGRSAEDARRIVSLDALVYSGNHGMEIWRGGALERSPLAERFAPDIGRALEEFETRHQSDTLYIEQKSLTASIHYRSAPEPVSMRDSILSTLAPIADRRGLTITEGRMVIELRPPVDLNKGTSVLELIREYELESCVYFGDDVTDVDAFEALRSLRMSSGKRCFAIGVASPETPDVVREKADALVDGVDGVVSLLQSIVDGQRLRNEESHR
jgi:trehalose 6-phosphate phosphatase